MKKLITTALGVVCFAGIALSDWDAPKWVQLPDTTTYGMDIRIDRNDGVERKIADDFLCTEATPITDIHFWGSWKGDMKGQITNIHLSIHSDVASGQCTAEYSTPGRLLWESDFGTGEFTERFYRDISPTFEWWWDPYKQELIEEGDQNIWQYNIFINPADAFVQLGTPENPIVYWLDISVETDGVGEFGWKTSYQHWNDDAVALEPSSGGLESWMELKYPFDTPCWQGDSVDMAFVVTPEPATIFLLGLGGLIIRCKTKRN